MLLLSKILFEGFDFEQFKQLAKSSTHPDTIEKQKDYAWKGITHPEIDYAKKNLQYLNAGSSRAVFALDDNRVLKIAKNQFGLEQNQNEVEIWNTLKNGSKVLTAIYDYDKENYKWVVHERVKMFSAEEFENLTKISTDIFVFVISYFVDGDGIEDIKWYINNPNSYPEPFIRKLEKLVSNPSAIKFVEDMARIVRMFGLEQGDIVWSHFGLAKDGHIKLYDYGYLE